MVLIASQELIKFLPQLSFWFAGTAAVLKGEHPYKQHPVNVLRSGRVSEKYFVKKRHLGWKYLC